MRKEFHPFPSLVITFMVLPLLSALAGTSLAGNAEKIEIGQAAPDFTLQATTGEDISLADYRGASNVLVAFYPLDFAPG